MKIIIACLLLLTAEMTAAQDTVHTPRRPVAVDELVKTTDSAMKAVQRKLDSVRALSLQQDAERNGAAILSWQKERQAQQKRKMFMYLGLGIFFLVVLVFGLLRKRKVKG